MSNQTLSYNKTESVLVDEKGGTNLTIQDKKPVIGENWKRAPCDCQERQDPLHSHNYDLKIINEMIQYRTNSARCPSHNTTQYTQNIDKSYDGDMDKAMKLIPCSCNMKKYLDCDCNVKANLCECQKRTACPEDWHHVSLYEKTGDFTNKTCQCYIRTAVCEYNTMNTNTLSAELRSNYKFQVLNEGIENYLDTNPQLCDCDSRTIYNCKCKFRHTEDCNCNSTKKINCKCKSRQTLSCVVDTETGNKVYGNLYNSKYWKTGDSKATVIDCNCKARLFNTTDTSNTFTTDNNSKAGSAKCECYLRLATIYDEAGNLCECVERNATGCFLYNDIFGSAYSIGCECYARDHTKIPGYDCLCKQRGNPGEEDCLRDGIDKTFCVTYVTNTNTNNKNYYKGVTNINANTYYNNNTSNWYNECDCYMRGFTSCYCDLRYSAYIQCKCNLRTGEEGGDCDCRYRTYSTGCDIYNIDSRTNDYTFYSSYTGDTESAYQLYVLKNCPSNRDNAVSCTSDYMNMDACGYYDCSNKTSICSANKQYEDVDSYKRIRRYYTASGCSYHQYYLHSECDCKNRDANDCLCKKRTTSCSCYSDSATRNVCDCNSRTSTEKTEPKCYCQNRTLSNCVCDHQSVSCTCDLRTQDSSSSSICDTYSSSYNSCECRFRMTPNTAECDCQHRSGICSCYSRQNCLCVEKIQMCICDKRFNEFISCLSNLIDHNRDHENYCLCDSKIIEENESTGEHLCVCRKKFYWNTLSHDICQTKYTIMKVSPYSKIPLAGTNYYSGTFGATLSGHHDFHKHLLDYSGFDEEE